MEAVSKEASSDFNLHHEMRDKGCGLCERVLLDLVTGTVGRLQTRPHTCKRTRGGERRSKESGVWRDKWDDGSIVLHDIMNRSLDRKMEKS